MRRLYDCFCFFRELDVLEIRLRELSPLVDRFVLVESIWDFAGDPKPLFFEQNRDRFSEFADRLVHIVVRDRPLHGDRRFAYQHHQRDCIELGLADADPDDNVLISDVDEIPSRRALEEARNILERRNAFVVFRMAHHSIRLNLAQPGRTITGSRMVRHHHFRTPHLVRRLKHAYWKGWPDWLDQIPAMANALGATGRPLRRVTLQDAGWHLNSMGDAELLNAKWNAFLTDEREMGQTPWDEWIGPKIADGTVAGALGLNRVPLSQLPATIVRDPERYAHLIDG